MTSLELLDHPLVEPPPAMPLKAVLTSPLLAAVDLGSNSFRMILARREGGQVVPISTWRESVRLAAGLDKKNRLSEAKIVEAEAALARFAERLRGLPPAAVRAVATSTFRVATNQAELLARAEAALGGIPIEIVSGPEEARLIYIGCAHTLPWSEAPRLIIDIGGGSTEFIIGRGYEPELTESFPLGAVTLSQHFFPEGVVTAAAFRKAEVFVRSRLEVLPQAFKQSWSVAFGASGTVRAIHDIVLDNNLDVAITSEGLTRLTRILVEAGRMDAVRLNALKPQRAPVLPGGLAILAGLIHELRIARLEPAEGALRLGALYDLLDRAGVTPGHDPRELTVSRLQARYGASLEQAANVGLLADRLWRSLGHDSEDLLLVHAAALHEIGMAIAHEDYHHHGAYIIAKSDMYGFPERERQQLAQLVLGHTGSLKKLEREHFQDEQLERLLCLRLAAIFCHGRSGQQAPAQLRRRNGGYQLSLDESWLNEHPLTAFLLEEECERCERFGISLRVSAQ